MNVIERLRNATEDIWNSYYTHSFILGIQEGNLPQEKFAYYMVQDYYYLLQYVKVFAVGVQKAKDEETMAYFAGVQDYILNHEMEIHRNYMEKLGITKEQLEKIPSELDNRSYTSYMLEVSMNGSIRDILVAVLACAVSYEYIAREIVKRGGNMNHPFYGEWISSYSSEEYHQNNMSLIAMVEDACEGISEKEYLALEEIMVNCSKYEYLFWDFSYEYEN